jgi:putative phosphoserine phosphatase / 1-acylglycerol-3-phosphate O-acyltransferase
LASVGRPHAVNPQRGLIEAARLQGWPELRLREPTKTGLRSVLGTAAALAAGNAGLGLGLALGAVNRDRRFGINTGIALACDSALALAGVRLDVIGEHNLWRNRPAIFIGNHTSTIDPVVLGALVRRDFTAVAKAEARYDPRSVIGSLLLDPAYIDRSDSEQARAELDKLVQRIRAGTSVMIFPEVTRAATPVLGPFKKGAFHLAAQAGVPIVPVVLRNAGEVMWRRSLVINPGTVQVCVLDPIPSDDWAGADMGRIAAQVRQRFVETLEKWPGDSS